MHTRAISILERKEGETGKQRERQRERESVQVWERCGKKELLASVIKLTVGKNPVTSFGDKPEWITIFWETILMEKWDRKDT